MDPNGAYKILGLKPTASIEDAKKAWHELAKQWHPDKVAHNPELHHLAQEKLKAINVAYEVVRSYRAVSQTENQNQKSSSGVEDTPKQNTAQARPNEEYNRRQSAEGSTGNGQQEQTTARTYQECRDKALTAKSKWRRGLVAVATTACVGWLGLTLIHTTPAKQTKTDLGSSQTLPGVIKSRLESPATPPVENILFDKLGDLHSLIGASKSKIHQAIGQPDLSFNHPPDLQEEEVSKKGSAIFTTFQDNKAVQIEVTVARSVTGIPTLDQFKEQHPNLESTRYFYYRDGYDKLPSDQKDLYNQEAHLFMGKEIDYNDDIDHGIACTTNEETDKKLSSIIIHQAGKQAIPALYGSGGG